jgi:hypothetical protein
MNTKHFITALAVALSASLPLAQPAAAQPTPPLPGQPGSTRPLPQSVEEAQAQAREDWAKRQDQAVPSDTQPAPGMTRLTDAQSRILGDLIIGELEMEAYFLGDKSKAGSSAKIAGAYARVGQDAATQPAALSRILSEYYELKTGARSAQQVSQAANEATVRLSVLQAAQNRRIIEQNDALAKQNAQIIALLKQIAKK